MRYRFLTEVPDANKDQQRITLVYEENEGHYELSTEDIDTDAQELIRVLERQLADNHCEQTKATACTQRLENMLGEVHCNSVS